MKKIEDYKRFGLDYCNEKVKIKENKDRSIESGRVKILDCGCVVLDGNKLEEPCDLHCDIDALKNAKLKEIQNECENIIYDKYPIHKQNNIGIFGTDEERNNFKNYKEKITGQYHSFVEQVNKLKKVENIKDFSFEFQLKGE